MNEVGHETAVPHRGSTRRTHSGGFLTHSEWVRISEPRKGEAWRMGEVPLIFVPLTK